MNRHSGLEFENLVYELFLNLGRHEVQRGVELKDSYGNRQRVDFLIGERGNIHSPLTVVEIKYYRLLSLPSILVVKNAIDQLKRHMEVLSIHNGLLIIPCKVNRHQLAELESSFGIEIWTVDILIEKAYKYPKILMKISDFLELHQYDSIKYAIKSVKKETQMGKCLINQFQSIHPGREDASKFEAWCTNALKYLFGEYLTRWHEQSVTTDNLNRRDLVCRVLDGDNSEIWKLILHTLRSRYVVFEFKNYTNEIGQHEIITTERYLYPTALRNCAIILSREGVSKNAKLTIQGAMREHGKLIISLNYNDISEMLEGKDNGEDPNVYLFDKVDEFLIGLGR